jgi:hypothetical protein
MKTLNRSTRLITAAICLGIMVAICGVIAVRRAGAVIAIIQPAVIFTVNPGQTARINVVGPSQYTWSTGISRRMVLGFDVYRNNDGPPPTGETSCVRSHMVQRQACEVVLAPGQAASFDFAVPSDGVATQISPVVLVDSNDAIGAVNTGDLIPTIEFREAGRTTGLVFLPAIQRVQTVQPPDDRR